MLNSRFSCLSITIRDLQDVIDECPLKHASLELIVTLFHQMYKYAGANNLVDKDYSIGVKTKSSKDRYVPIRSAILPLVEKRLLRDKKYINSAPDFRGKMYDKLEALGIDKHTPHDCRYTFSMFCDKY